MSQYRSGFVAFLGRALAKPTTLLALALLDRGRLFGEYDRTLFTADRGLAVILPSTT